MMDSEENGLLNLNRKKWSNLNITPLLIDSDSIVVVLAIQSGKID